MGLGQRSPVRRSLRTLDQAQCHGDTSREPKTADERSDPKINHRPLRAKCIALPSTLAALVAIGGEPDYLALV